jgi:hypothetical protein
MRHLPACPKGSGITRQRPAAELAHTIGTAGGKQLQSKGTLVVSVAGAEERQPLEPRQEKRVGAAQSLADAGREVSQVHSAN